MPTRFLLELPTAPETRTPTTARRSSISLNSPQRQHREHPRQRSSGSSNALRRLSGAVKERGVFEKRSKWPRRHRWRCVGLCHGRDSLGCAALKSNTTFHRDHGIRRTSLGARLKGLGTCYLTAGGRGGEIQYKTRENGPQTTHHTHSASTENTHNSAATVIGRMAGHADRDGGLH